MLGTATILGLTTTIFDDRSILISAIPLVKFPDEPEAYGSRPLTPRLVQWAGKTVFIVPDDLSDLERRMFEEGRVAESTARRVTMLQRVMAAADDDTVAVATAARFFYRGFLADDFGEAVASYFICLEGLLLHPEHKDNVTGRIIEAVTMAVARGKGARDEARQTVKDLYDLRSKYVHTGTLKETRGVRARCERLVREVLRREIEGLL